MEVHWLILIFAVIGVATSIVMAGIAIVIAIVVIKEFILANNYKGKEEIYSTLSMMDRYCSEIPIIVETAAMNERLKKMGYHSAQEFNRNILRWLESESARAVYFGKDDSI